MRWAASLVCPIQRWAMTMICIFWWKASPAAPPSKNCRREQDAVIHELLRRKAAAAPETLHRSKKPRHYNEIPGRMTAKQQKYAWFLMSELEKYDPAP